MSVPKIVTASFVVLAALATGLGGLAYAQSKEGIKPSAEKRAADEARRIADKRSPESELKSLQGNWRLVAWTTRDGSKNVLAELSEEERKSISLRVRGDAFEFRINGNLDAQVIRLDPSASPAAIDAIRPKGPTVGPRDVGFLGIYKLDGDRLTICLAGADRERPRSFEERNDDRFGSLFVYERHEAKAPADGNSVRKPKLSAIRLGASRDEIVEKMGQANDSVELASGIESLRYDRGPIRVLVEISPATKCVVQIYYKKATPFTSIQIAELLERNAEGSKWLPLAVSEDSCQYDRLDGGSARGGKVGETYQLAVLSGSVVKGRNPRADAEREKEKESLKEIE